MKTKRAQKLWQGEKKTNAPQMDPAANCKGVRVDKDTSANEMIFSRNACFLLNMKDVCLFLVDWSSFLPFFGNLGSCFGFGWLMKNIRITDCLV